MKKLFSNLLSSLMYEFSRTNSQPARAVLYALLCFFEGSAIKVAIQYLYVWSSPYIPGLVEKTVSYLLTTNITPIMFVALTIWILRLKIAEYAFLVSNALDIPVAISGKDDRMPENDRERIEVWFRSHAQKINALIKDAKQKHNFQMLHMLKRLGLLNCGRI